MTSKVEINISNIELVNRIEKVWSKDCNFGSIKELKQKENNVELTQKVTNFMINKMINIHPLIDIAKSAISDILEHSKALHQLNNKKVSILHARQIEEIFVTLSYLISKPDSYNEFKWRWDNFKYIHIIRNRIFNIKLPLDISMTEWIDQNINWLKSINKKFQGDVTKDEKIWKKFSNWLYPITLKEIFEKVGNLDSYYFQSYEWTSHAVHLSPISDQYYNFDFTDGTFVDIINDFVEFNVASLLKILEPLSENSNEFRKMNVQVITKLLYHMLIEQPERFLRFSEKSQKIKYFIGEFARPDISCKRLIKFVSGNSHEDPLVIKIHDGN